MNKPHLVNAVHYSELYPEFEVLPHSDRISLRAGDVAKVCVRFDGVDKYQGERFWVLIVTGDNGVYTGTVDNNLEHTDRHGFKYGDTIAFDYRHIYDFARGPFGKKSEA